MGDHSARCVAYIDLNMVAARRRRDPWARWETGGYQQIQAPRARHRIVDGEAKALGLDEVTLLAGAHSEWIAAAMRTKQPDRRIEWTQSMAVGSREFVERVEAELGVRSWY